MLKIVMNKFYVLLLFILLSCNNNPTSSDKKITVKDSVATTAPAKKTKKQIYLTFDDGPTKGSQQLYKFIETQKLPVGLFLVGEHYLNMPSLHKKLDSLSTLNYVLTANHSYTHAFNDKYKTFYDDLAGVYDDYKKSEAVLPLNSNIARTAGRNFWRLPTITITDNKGPANGPDSLVKAGYQFVGWDCTWPYDYKTLANKRTVAGMMNRLKIYFDSSFTKVPNHLIVLIHDQQLSKADNFKEFEEFVTEINNSPIYEFAKLSDYPALAKIVAIKPSTENKK